MSESPSDTNSTGEKRRLRSCTSESDVVYEDLETISLETSADITQMSAQLGIETLNIKENEIILTQPSQSEIVNNGNDNDEISTEEFHSLPPMDPRSLFHNLSAGTSPMMKSMADITILDEQTEIGTDAISEQEQALGSKEPEIPTKDPPLMQQSLQHFFEEDKFGSDVAGKAFFDEISALNNNAPIEGSNEALSKDKFNTTPSPFSSPLSTTEQFFQNINEQYFDSWIPSNETRNTLIAVVTSNGTFFPDNDKLTMPGIIIEDVLVDPIKCLMSELKWDEVNERQCLTAECVSQDEKGLKQLINAGCLNAAVNLTTRLITALGQGPGKGGQPCRHSPYSLQLWYTRLSLFIKLRKFSFAEVESEAFENLDKCDMYYEYYSDTYPGRKGSMAPFSFRLLLAELPQHQGNYHGALDRLYSLLAIVNKILENLSTNLAEDGSMVELNEYHKTASLKLWQARERRILFSILNCMLSQKDFSMAIGVAKSLIEKDKSSTAALQSALGKIYLQLGDVKSASDCFTIASSERSRNVIVKVEHQVEDLVNRALMCISQNVYEDAYKLFQEAYKLQPKNSALANNMAVCLLYMGKLKESLSTLEETIQENPKQCLHEGILFNTCILYELESTNSLVKKENMLRLAAKHAGDSFQISCLKINAQDRQIDKRRDV